VRSRLGFGFERKYTAHARARVPREIFGLENCHFLLGNDPRKAFLEGNSRIGGGRSGQAVAFPRMSAKVRKRKYVQFYGLDVKAWGISFASMAGFRFRSTRSRRRGYRFRTCEAKKRGRIVKSTKRLTPISPTGRQTG